MAYKDPAIEWTAAGARPWEGEGKEHQRRCEEQGVPDKGDEEEALRRFETEREREKDSDNVAGPGKAGEKYLVKWKGLGYADLTWEDADAIDPDRISEFLEPEPDAADAGEEVVVEEEELEEEGPETKPVEDKDVADEVRWRHQRLKTW